MSRISQTFERLRREGKRGLIPFITAGDPSLSATRELVVELARSGADLIELGVPFSDPVADGPVIQRSSMRGIENDVGVADILQTVQDVRRETNVPIVLFSYVNPLLQFGLDRLAEEAGQVGVDGVLVTDLPLEESGDFQNSLASNGLDLVLLVAPTTKDERLREIAKNATGFIYVIARAGVTGAHTDTNAEARTLVQRVREVSSLPVAVGFGISSREQVAEVWTYADAAVVGSALVAEIERLKTAADLAPRVASFVQSFLPNGR